MDQLDNRQLLKNQQIKFTQQRSITLDVLRQSEVPLSAEQVFMQVKALDSMISLSTVYRILDLFIIKAMVLKVNISDDHRAMYELNNLQHKHHLICTACKRIMVLDSCPFAEYEQLLAQKTNYHITAHKFEIFGLCPQCQTSL
jgi:Fur family transcriptional regulator, ferric uptake regulator